MSLISGSRGKEIEMKLFIIREVFNWSKWLCVEQKAGNTAALSVSKLCHWINSKLSFDSGTRKFHTIQIHGTGEWTSNWQ